MVVNIYLNNIELGDKKRNNMKSYYITIQSEDGKVEEQFNWKEEDYCDIGLDIINLIKKIKE